MHCCRPLVWTLRRWLARWIGSRAEGWSSFRRAVPARYAWQIGDGLGLWHTRNGNHSRSSPGKCQPPSLRVGTPVSPMSFQVAVRLKVRNTGEYCRILVDASERSVQLLPFGGRDAPGAHGVSNDRCHQVRPWAHCLVSDDGLKPVVSVGIHSAAPIHLQCQRQLRMSDSLRAHFSGVKGVAECGLRTGSFGKFMETSCQG